MSQSHLLRPAKQRCKSVFRRQERAFSLSQAADFQKQRYRYEFQNGEKVRATFSQKEMSRRARNLRQVMQDSNVDAVLMTSMHNINYHSDFLYCSFGRNYGLIAKHEGDLVSVSAGIDGGQPWRRTATGRNVVYTDWAKDNFFRVVRDEIGSAKRVGVEFDHMNIQNFAKLKAALPDGVEIVDVGEPLMRKRMVKSAEEIEHIKFSAWVADRGGEAVVEACAVGVPEHDVALASVQCMVRHIADKAPGDIELMDTWCWFQSGINTDGAHNPVTARKLQKGDILSLNCFPMPSGYYTALERTLFMGEPDKESLRLWEANVAVHKRGLELIKPGAKCSDIALELNNVYDSYDLLKYRSFGYGHSFGVLCHYYGREAGLELREDVHTVLEPGMVVSMEPMITVPEGVPGAGGYREHDILVVGENDATNITGFPYGPCDTTIISC